jgi:hypothetical protein
MEEAISRRALLRRGTVGATGLAAAAFLAACSRSSNKANRPSEYDALAYGVRWDGKTDDTVALAALESKVHAAGGGVIVFPGGTGIAHAVKQSLVHWRGAGYEATVLRGSVIGENFAQLTGTNSTGGISAWSISDMTIDGGGGNVALQVYGFGYALNNVRIRNSSGDGFYSEWSTEAATPGQDAMEAQINGLKVHDCGGKGVNFNGPHDSQIVDLICYQCQTPLSIAASATAAGIQLTNVHVWNATAGGTFSAIVGGSGCVLSDWQAEGGQTGEIQLLGNDIKGQGLRCFSPADGRDVYGLQIGDSAHSVTGLDVEFDVYQCTRGALNFAGDGGSNRLSGQAYLANGSNYVTGTVNSSTYCELQQTGQGGGHVVIYENGGNHTV